MSDHNINAPESEQLSPDVEIPAYTKVESDALPEDNRSEAPPKSAVDDRPNYPGPWRFAIIMICAGCAAFLVGYVSMKALEEAVVKELQLSITFP